MIQINVYVYKYNIVYFVKCEIYSTNKYSENHETDINRMFEFLIDNVYVEFGSLICILVDCWYFNGY